MSESWLHRQWRRWFGRFVIDDPRPIAATARYTFFLPSENELLALRPGDLVKAVFRSVPFGGEWDSERMWATIVRVDGERLRVTLANDPYDMPQLRAGRALTLRRSDVIGIEWGDARGIAPPSSPPRRTYWERCMVDACVIDGRSRVDYLYRETPDMTQAGDRDPDSGWRFRGTSAGIADDEANGRAPDYVALGVVLNRDDSWLALIDEPVGARFTRDEASDGFVPVGN